MSSITPTSTRTRFALRVNEVGFYGWIIMVVAFVSVWATGPAQSHTAGVFFDPVGKSLDLSRISISYTYAVGALVSSLVLPYLGILIDRYGPRTVLLWVSFALGWLAIGFSAVRNFVDLAIVFALLRTIGHGGLMIAANNLVVQWFNRRRGLALSVTAMGFSASLAIHPPLSQWLTEQHDWRTAWVVFAVVTWLILLPLIAWFVHNKPEQLGLLPDGSPGAESNDAGDKPATDADIGLTLTEARRTSAFWILAATAFLLSAFLSGLLVHQSALLVDKGLSAQTAANQFTFTAIAMAVSMPLIGHALDRWPTKLVYGATPLALALTSLALIWVDGLSNAFVYSILLGISTAMIHTTFTYTWAKFFGRKHLGSIQGFAHIMIVAGAAAGTMPLVYAYDLFGGYSEMLILQALLLVGCTISIAWIRPPGKGVGSSAEGVGSSK